MLKVVKMCFGFGWAWLVVDVEGWLFVIFIVNQDNFMMRQVVDQFGYFILGIDVWEYVYYLKYQNRCGDYLEAVWNVVNWEVVSK